MFGEDKVEDKGMMTMTSGREGIVNIVQVPVTWLNELYNISEARQMRRGLSLMRD